MKPIAEIREQLIHLQISRVPYSHCQPVIDLCDVVAAIQADVARLKAALEPPTTAAQNPEPIGPAEMWVNIYEDGPGACRCSRELAEKTRGCGCLSTVCYIRAEDET